MKPRYDFERPEAHRMFEILDEQLAKQPLPTQYGKPRTARAREFMIMHQDTETGTYGFKHCDTRNYLFLLPVGDGTFELYVPISKEPFMRGFFDAYHPHVHAPVKENSRP